MFQTGVTSGDYEECVLIVQQCEEVVCQRKTRPSLLPEANKDNSLFICEHALVISDMTGMQLRQEGSWEE